MLTLRSTSCASILLLAGASVLSASDTTFVSQGVRVRVKFEQEAPAADRSGAVWYRSETVQNAGTATGLGSDTLVFLPEGADTPLRIPTSTIERIEVSEGRKSNAGKGAWIGALAGTLAGIGFGAAVECGDAEQGACVLVGAGMFGAGGALVGLGVGAATSSERWVDADLPPPAVALKVGSDGSVRLAFSLRL